MTTPQPDPAPTSTRLFERVYECAVRGDVAGLTVPAWCSRSSSARLLPLRAAAPDWPQRWPWPSTVAFFAGGLYVMTRVVNASPISVLTGALAVYLGQILVLAVVIFGLSGPHWLDGRSFGIAAFAVAIGWQVCQVVVFVRMRKSVYDAPSADDLARPGPPGDLVRVRQRRVDEKVVPDARSRP